MKQTTKTTTLALLALASATTSQAALSITPGYTNPGTDGDAFLYSAKGTFSDDSYAIWSTTASVGGWSYDNTDTPEKRGWGHTSEWYLLEIAETTPFILNMSSSAADARPGFVIFAGESIEDNPGAAHTYSNDGTDMSLNDGWDNNGIGGARGLTYVTHGVNTTANSLGQGMILAPGLYTIAVGNSASASLAPGAPTYAVSFTVPEPSGLALALMGGLLAFRRSR